MCMTIRIMDDDILEEAVEYFFADLSLMQTERVVFDPQRTRINIMDNDSE